MSSLTLRRTVCCVLMAVLMICLIPAQTADAAAKAYKHVDPNTPEKGEPGDIATAKNPAYCQGKYFWFEYPGTICEYPKLMCSSKKGGKGVCIIDTAAYQGGFGPEVPVDRRHRGIMGLMTNGTYVYFGMRDLSTGNNTVYRIKCDGTGRKVIGEIPKMENGNFISVYNGQIYYFAEWDGWSGENYKHYRKIGSLSVKTGKVYNRKNNAVPHKVDNLDDRYIAYTNENYKSENYGKTYIYDCKEKTTECLGKIVSPRVSKGKLYYAVACGEEVGYDIYKEAVSGRGKRTLAATLEEACCIDQISNKYIYWMNYDYEPYRYNIETEKSIKVKIENYKQTSSSWY